VLEPSPGSSLDGSGLSLEELSGSTSGVGLGSPTSGSFGLGKLKFVSVFIIPVKVVVSSWF
jgi:hypothetical protein